MNDEFQKFVRKVEEASAGELEFDIPYRDLGFHGVPHRSSVFMQPTVNCLVHLTEPPFTVVTLNEVEVASLERVQFSLKNFDLVFIFKNFSFTHINTIPMDSLETIKEWLEYADAHQCPCVCVLWACICVCVYSHHPARATSSTTSRLRT